MHTYISYKIKSNPNHPESGEGRLDWSRGDSGEASREISRCPILFEHRSWEFIGHPDFCEQAVESACGRSPAAGAVLRAVRIGIVFRQFACCKDQKVTEKRCRL